LAAILDGHGGQQKRQHNSEKDKPIPLIVLSVGQDQGLKKEKKVWTDFFFQLH